MRKFVYSFEECTVTFRHPTYGVYSAYGTGLGNFTVSYSNDVVDHQISADLAVVVSKHAIKNGQIEFNILQASDFNEWLKGWANHIENGPIENFAMTDITIKNRSTGDTYFCSGCTHQKIADDSYQSSAQERTWTILAANIVTQ